MCQLFFHEESIYENPSMHGSEVMLCIKKRNGWTDARTDTRTHARTNVPEAICPFNYFEVGGIMIGQILSTGALICL